MARKPFHEKIYVFLVFSSSASGQKSQCRLPWINTSSSGQLGLSFSNDFLSFLKSGLQWEKWRGEPDLKLVRWRQSGLLRPAQTQTSHMCPDPGSQYGLLEKPTHQGLCNQEEQLWGPQSQTPIQPPSHTTPPLLWTPLAETCFLCSQGNLSKHIYSLVLTLISALMRTHSADFKLGKKAKENVSRETTRGPKTFLVTTLCIDCPHESRCH